VRKIGEVAGRRHFGKTLDFNFVNFVLRTHNMKQFYSNNVYFLKILKESKLMYDFFVCRRTRESSEEDVRELDQFLSVQGKNLTEVTVLLRCSV
jgi:hypothetical protein